MITDADIAAFRDSIHGIVLSPDDDGFDRAITIDNGRIKRLPALIVFPETSKDVAETIRFARQRSLRLTCKGGGHSYAGYCLNDGGVVVDLSRMKAMSLDRQSRTLTVQMGALWSDVYKYLKNSNTRLTPVGGACDTVGLPGFLLGGGYSFISRSFGLGCDNVLSWEIVTPDSVIHSISSSSHDPLHRELDWACRGGGGGNFGIVTEATLQLHETRSEKILTGNIVFPIDDFDSVMTFYNSWSAELPNEMAVYGYIGYLSHPSTSKPTLCLRLQPIFNGEFFEGMRILSPLFSFKPLETTLYAVSLLDYIEISGKATTIKGRQAYMRSGTMTEGQFTSEAIATIRTQMLRMPSIDSFILWMHQGGHTNSVERSATAYPHRDTEFVLEIVSVWDEDADLRKNVDWAFETGELLNDRFSGAFVNYIDPLLNQWSDKYYAENYSRLLDIKQKIDPNALMMFQQGIGSLFAPKNDGVRQSLSISPELFRP